MSMLRLASFILPWDRFSTSTITFPSINCIAPYGTSGSFFATFRIFADGREIAQVHSKCVNERGFIEVNFDDVLDMFNPTDDTVLISEFHHQRDIPVELYFSNVHRQTGVYLSYPALAFVGDQIYPQIHENTLENALFWPGVAATDRVRTEVAIVNPYPLPFSYQISLFLADGSRHQTKILKIRPFHTMWHAVDELFPEQYSQVIADHGTASLCISAQYKVVAFAVMRCVQSGIITTLDHLHAYQLV